MTRYRLLAFDLDGTFLDPEGRMPEEVVDFLDSLEHAGIRVVAATGRRLGSALPYLREAGLSGSCVVQNGAVVADIESGQTRWGEYVDERHAREVTHALCSSGFAPLVYCNPQATGDDSSGAGECFVARRAPDPTGYLEWYRDYARDTLIEVDEILDVPFQAVTRVVTHDQREHLLQLQAKVQETLSDRLRTFLSFDSARRVNRFEVLSLTATKWEGVHRIAGEWGVDAAEIVAVGDDSNDVEMLANAALSVAAAGATEPARAVATLRVHAEVDGAGPAGVVAVLKRVFEL